MTRYRLLIEYNGYAFNGWQQQKNNASVQEAIKIALKKFCGEECTIEGAGRTDAGVHATGMVAHADIQKPTEPRIILKALNAHLHTQPISIVKVTEVDQQFHARFSAIERHYCYLIFNRNARPTFEKHRAWHVPQDLNIHAMREASQIFVGRHDFTSFRSVHCQAASPVKTINAIDVHQSAPPHIEIRIQARSFLYNQVRIIVGGLVAVGRGKWTQNRLFNALEACDRTKGPVTAPPYGLYLTKVCYDETEE